MRTRAIAVASERSNAIGAVELECTPQGLVIAYLGVGAFAEGYAPGALTRGTQVVAPWRAVEEAQVAGDRLFLRVSEDVSPLNRLDLSHFTAGDAPHGAQQVRQRWLVRAGLSAAFAVIVLASAATLPRFATDASAATVLAVGCIAAVGLAAAGILAERRITQGSIDGDTARALFIAQLALYVPHLGVSLARPRRARPVSLSALATKLPRSTAAIVITLSSALLAAILTSSWVLRERAAPRRFAPREAGVNERAAPARPATGSAPAAAAATSASVPAPSAAAAAVPGAPCRCERADTVLWESPIPRLSTIIIEKRERAHKDHVHLELELGVVNNGDEDIAEVNVLVQFYERDPPPSSKRSPTQERPLFFEGPLRPGQAIKWHVEARGTEFEALHAIDGNIHAGGDNAAPANRFADLLEANHRPVRLHGAMMLAYLGDPRARAGALALRDALREDEAPYLDRLVRATDEVFTCRLTDRSAGREASLSTCVFNQSGEPRGGLGINARALDRVFDHTRPVAPPPLVLVEAKYAVPATLAPKSGVVMNVVLNTENPDGAVPKSFEVFAGAMGEL